MVGKQWFSIVYSTYNDNDADNAWCVRAADLDRDGDMDVMAVSRSDNKILWYKNDGSETFTEQSISTSALSSPSGIWPVDIDDDGDLDIAACSETDDKIVWFQNTGSAISSTANSVSNGDLENLKAIHAADIDGDQDMDLVAAGHDDDEIAWFENNGSGSFTYRCITTSADQAYSVFAVDLDDDGDMDVLSASRNDNKIAWYENNGSQSFTAHTISTGATDARCVYAADFDGDARMDVLCVSNDDDEVTWFGKRRERELHRTSHYFFF